MRDRKRKRYSEAFKKEAVMRVMGQNSSTYSVSRELGIRPAHFKQMGQKI